MSDQRRFTFGMFGRGGSPIPAFWGPTLTARDPSIPNLPLETPAVVGGSVRGVPFGHRGAAFNGGRALLGAIQ